MKKLFLLVVLFTTMYAANAQPAGDPPSVLEQMKEKQKPGLVEKAGLTAAQAEKFIELNFEMRQAAGALRDLSEADRSKKIAELKAAKEKKIAELLTPEQIQSVKAYYEEMAKNAPKKPGN